MGDPAVRQFGCTRRRVCQSLHLMRGMSDAPHEPWHMVQCTESSLPTMSAKKLSTANGRARDYGGSASRSSRSHQMRIPTTATWFWLPRMLATTNSPSRPPTGAGTNSSSAMHCSCTLPLKRAMVSESSVRSRLSPNPLPATGWISAWYPHLATSLPTLHLERRQSVAEVD